GPGLIAVCGEAGNAKTLFLELLLRLRLPHEGRYLPDGQDVRGLRVGEVRSRMGWVDRHATLIPAQWHGEAELARARVLRELAFLLPAGHGRSEEAHPVDARAHANRRTRGERLRAALSNALAGEPPLVLLDEPTEGLDADRIEQLIAWLAALARERL